MQGINNRHKIVRLQKSNMKAFRDYLKESGKLLGKKETEIYSYVENAYVTAMRHEYSINNYICCWHEKDDQIIQTQIKLDNQN